MLNQRDLIVSCLAVTLGLCIFFLIGGRDQSKELNEAAGPHSQDQQIKKQTTKPTDFGKTNRSSIKEANANVANHPRMGRAKKTENKLFELNNSDGFYRDETTSTTDIGFRYLNQLHSTHGTEKRIEILNRARGDFSEMAMDEIKSLVTLAMTDSSHNVREVGIDMLAEIDDDSTLSVVSAALTHENAEIRRDAVYALEGFDDINLPSMLTHGSRDPDEDVRNAYTDIIGRQPVPSQLKVFSHQIYSPYLDMKYDALYRLQEIGNGQALAIIRQGLHDSNSDFQYAVDQAITDLESRL